MTTSTSRIPFVVRGYRLLLRCYPAAHRRQFGNAMDQVFRDQVRACREPAGDGLRRLLIRTLFDFFRTCCTAHWDEFGRRGAQPGLAGFAHIELMGGAGVAALFCALVVVVTALMPRTYVSTTRFLARDSAPVPAADAPKDLARTLERVRSPRVLEAVATRLDLQTEWSREYSRHGVLRMSEVTELLANQIDLDRFRGDSRMFQLRIWNRDALQAASIANALVDVLRETATEPGSIVVTDQAAPAPRPMRPNVPLNVFTGILGGGIAGLLAAGTLRLLRWLRGGGSASRLSPGC